MQPKTKGYFMQYEELYGKKLVEFNLELCSNGFKVTTKNFIAKNPKKNLIPAQNCVLILDGCSVGVKCLYDFHGLNVIFTDFGAAKVSCFGYCLEENFDTVLEQFKRQAERFLHRWIADRVAEINKLDKVLLEL